MLPNDTRNRLLVTGLVAALVLLVSTGVALELRVRVLLLWDLVLLFGSGLTLLLLTRERSLRTGQAQPGDGAAAKTESASPALSWVVVVLAGLTVLADRAISPAQLAGAGRAVLRVVDAPLAWMGKVVGLIVARWVLILFSAIAWAGRLMKRVLPQEPTDLTQIAGRVAPSDRWQ